MLHEKNTNINCAREMRQKQAKQSINEKHKLLLLVSSAPVVLLLSCWYQPVVDLLRILFLLPPVLLLPIDLELHPDHLASFVHHQVPQPIFDQLQVLLASSVLASHQVLHHGLHHDLQHLHSNHLLQLACSIGPLVVLDPGLHHHNGHHTGQSHIQTWEPMVLVLSLLQWVGSLHVDCMDRPEGVLDDADQVPAAKLNK